MYAPTDFDAPKLPDDPNGLASPQGESARALSPERATGLIVLLIFVALCLLVSMSLDQEFFNPLNTVIPITETHRARMTGTPGQPPRATPRRENRQVNAQGGAGYETPALPIAAP